MTSNLFLSVVRAWRFTDNDGRTIVSERPGERRATIGALNGGVTRAAGFDLPWPPFPSRFWSHTLGRDDYRSTPADVLVRTLVPLRAMLPIEFEHPLRIRTPLAEVFVEPFGVWTSVTIDLSAEWDDDGLVSDAIDGAMHTPITLAGRQSGQLRNGIDASEVADHVQTPWAGIPTLVECGTITLTSGVCPSAADVMERAPQFRSQFKGGVGGTVHRLTQSKGASATTARQIGLVLASTSSRAPSLVKCLHHNHSLLAGQMLLFGRLAGAQASVDAEVYRDLAARYLNHLHRGVAMRDAGIYKSRTAPAWIEQSDLLETINMVTALFARDPVPPLVPAPPLNNEIADD